MNDLIEKKKKGKLREYTESLAVALLIAFFIRSFAIEAFRIPSGSMIPTLMIGDHIFVNKFLYGLRVPFTKKRIVHFRNPERGEAVVFMYPVDEGKDFIKRVIGLPGDRLLLQGDEILVNGKPLERSSIAIRAGEAKGRSLIPVVPDAVASEVGLRAISYFQGWEDFHYYAETTGRVHHLVQYDDFPSPAVQEIEVPPDHIFVMGDNRDNSSDSRDWGFVPLENIKGKAMFVWLSVDFERKTLRWDRFGKWIK